MARRRRGRGYGGGHGGYGGYGGWSPYVPVAERRRQAARKVAALKKKGLAVAPIVVEGRLIARSFWGRAWCENLERYSDFENRLPRGRTYARNGSVLHLAIEEGCVDALVQGSETYEVEVRIAPVAAARWQELVERSAGGIDSLVELLRGRFSKAVMEVMTEPRAGLFPASAEISFSCSCPDWASMCKHVAAVLYGVGARLDHEPAHLFRLRGVDPAELLAGAVSSDLLGGADDAAGDVLEGDLSDVFGIDLDLGSPAVAPAPPTPKPPTKRREPRRPARPHGGTKVSPGPAEKPASKKTSKARRPRATEVEAETVTRAELIAAGVPPGTLSTWLHQGVLEKTGRRGVYRHTAASKGRLASRAAPPAPPAAVTGGGAEPAHKPDTVARADLLEAGLTPGAISAWLYYGMLEKTDRRGVYRHTEESRERLASRGK